MSWMNFNVWANATSATSGIEGQFSQINPYADADYITAAARARLELRRIGNICECARAAGWTARLAESSRGYCLQWRGPQGEVVSGPGWEPTAERAVYAGAEAVEGRI